MKLFRFIGKLVIVLLFLLAFGYVSLALFLPDKLDLLRAEIWDGVEDELVVDWNQKVNIGFPERIKKLDPMTFTFTERSVLLNIYEPLIAIDNDLAVKPGLAVSWGRLSNTIWEFRLRKDVRLHTGKNLDANMVLESLEEARFGRNSDLKSLLTTIADIKVIGEDRIHIITKKPDPLLLNKISTALVAVDGVGTGPYRLVSQKNQEIALTRFDDYWGERPFYRDVSLHFLPNLKQRLKYMLEDKLDLLVNVPPRFLERFEGDDFQILVRPNLQVNFILFNTRNSFFKNVEVRKALRMLFDKEVFRDLTNGYAKEVNQFVSNGVFGFNPRIEAVEYDLEKAREIIRKHSGFRRPKVNFLMVKDLKNFGSYIVKQLELAGISVEVQYLEQSKLEKMVKKGTFSAVFFGWRSELGDVSDFLQTMVHSRDQQKNYGLYNGGIYESKLVDGLIEASEENLVVEKRKAQVHEIMDILVNKDVIGVPLYESEVIYVFDKDLNFQSRVDGYVLATNLKQKQ